MDWYELTGQFHEQTLSHDGELSSLPAEWQRELAALWRLEADVNNGGYLQFFVNWGRDSYVYAYCALKKIGADTMATIIDRCQALIDEHWDSAGCSSEQRRQLTPNVAIGPDGRRMEKTGPTLPASVLARIHQLSREFMSYPDDLARLGLDYYRDHLGNNT